MEYRTHARTHSVRMKRKSAFGTAIVVLLSIGLIALIIALSPIGAFLSDHVFVPLFETLTGSDRDQKIVSALAEQEAVKTPQPSAEPSNAPEIERVLTVDETPFYILQMGVFTDETAAEDHAEEIRRMGAGGFVYHDNAVFRVFAAAYLDEDSLVKVQGQVRSDGFEATPYITDSARVRITLRGDQNAINETEQAVSVLKDVPETLSKLALSFDKGECDAKQLKAQIKSMLDACEAKLTFFDTVRDESVHRFRTVLEKYQKSVSTFLNEYDSIVPDECASALKHLQIETIIDYILFFDQE